MVRKETMKQIAVRMGSELHRKALKAAELEEISFGEFVRRAVQYRVTDVLFEERVGRKRGAKACMEN
jgi:predicted HicB family RNase H-like nuclease